MGSYALLLVGDYQLIPSKYDVVPELMTIFRERDKKVVKRGDSEDGSHRIKYCTTAQIAAARLDVMGFSLERARREYEDGRTEQIDLWTEGEGDLDEGDVFYDSVKVLKTLDFDNYCKWLRVIIHDNLYDADIAGLAPELKYILRENESESTMAFHGGDLRLVVRTACACVDSDTPVEEDVSAIVSGGSYEEDDAVCDISLRRLVEDHPSNAPVIVLTEGSTDGAILEAALSILYPHLVGYYSFLDFEASRIQGGVGSLVSVVKAFAGAGITNRVIAMFDNDTAARNAVRTLAAVQLPHNLVVRHYPQLDLLRAYPTIGPTGVGNFDVNGLAASIELFLGADVLKKDGEFFPVQWGGYVESLQQYQGEVSNKGAIQDRFREKVNGARANPDAINRRDWADLDKVLRVMFDAFPH